MPYSESSLVCFAKSDFKVVAMPCWRMAADCGNSWFLLVLCVQTPAIRPIFRKLGCLGKGKGGGGAQGS